MDVVEIQLSYGYISSIRNEANDVFKSLRCGCEYDRSITPGVDDLNSRICWKSSILRLIISRSAETSLEVPRDKFFQVVRVADICKRWL